MAVQEAVRTVAVPRQAAPADPVVAAPLLPETPAPVATAPVLGRDRPLSAEERQFAIALAVMGVVLKLIIVTGLVMAQNVWG